MLYFLKFKGGKGVATGLGIILFLAPWETLIVFAVWVVIVAITRIVSLGSIVAAVLVPILMYVFGEPLPLTIFGLLAAILVVVRHKDNINPLDTGAGTEGRTNSGKNRLICTKKTCIIDYVRAGDLMRIISGSARGRILKSPKGMLTRPTLDRTRESLFNMLESRGSLAGARVLDIFAGTGALGLEALSRGADSAVFIDHYTQALIRQNASLCGFDERSEVLRLPSAKALARLKGRQFDYIFADPPYNKNLVNDTIVLIGQYDLLAPGGLILMEYSRNEGITENTLYEVIREKSYGNDTRIAFIRHRREGV